MRLSLYIHFPFCLQKCLYCDFNSLADSQIAAADYVATVVREMELCAEGLQPPVVASTLYFGGGTPSLMAPELVERVLDTSARLFGLDGTAEVTLEANPGTLTKAKLAGYRAAGANRLSLGIQSFNDHLLKRLGRVHNAREATEAFAAARGAGFANVGIDLIHSLPGQTLEMWRNDLAKGVILAPEHISAYGLSVEEGTPFHRLEKAGELDLPHEEQALLMFQETAALLRESGYDHYEISNFARPGFRSRHNQVYWQRGSYLGFGAGAHSFMPTPGFGTRWKNPASPAGYMEAVRSGLLPKEEVTVLTGRDAMAERLFLGLRMREGVEGEAFRREFGVTLGEAYPAELPGLLAAGLLQWEGGRLRLTDRGLAISNQVFLKFL